MPFPKSERVTYEKNPLFSVVCQVAFPVVLKIDAELPVDFQERIRDRFPIYSQPSSLKFGDMPDHEIPPDLLKIANLTKTYKFNSMNSEWSVTLTNSFLSLVCYKYTSWESFKDQWDFAFNALIDSYNIKTSSRVGLRYHNFISLKELKIENTSWSELLQSYIAGELDNQDVSNDIVSVQKQITIRIQEIDSYVQINHGFVEKVQDPSKEILYCIDNDFFTQKQLEIKHVNNILESLHEQSGHCFRWCIKDALHQAMQPTTAN